jgi:hypothetical protein
VEEEGSRPGAITTQRGRGSYWCLLNWCLSNWCLSNWCLLNWCLTRSLRAILHVLAPSQHEFVEMIGTAEEVDAQLRRARLAHARARRPTTSSRRGSNGSAFSAIPPTVALADMPTPSQGWYGDRLAEPFAPNTIDELQGLLTAAGLTTDVWQLRP